MTRIYAPKRSCPRDLGLWYCEDCTEKHLEEASWLDFPIPIHGCDRCFGTKVCGVTPLGVKWCRECRAASRTELHPHIGQFEIVGTIQEA